MKAFFAFAHESRWISENPAKVLKGPDRIKPSQKLPFEPMEMERIVAACEMIPLQVGANTKLLAFVLLLRYSGLRIGDASMLTADRIVGNDLLLYTAKTGTHVRIPLPPYLIELIKKVDSRHGKYLFVGPESLRMETVSDLWRRKIARVLKVAKVEHGHPHRFRHTFAVELLKNGVPIEDVSTLLGHSSVRITEQHYSAWTKARQDILKAHVEKTWRLSAYSTAAGRPLLAEIRLCCPCTRGLADMTRNQNRPQPLADASFEALVASGQISNLWLQ